MTTDIRAMLQQMEGVGEHLQTGRPQLVLVSYGFLLYALRRSAGESVCYAIGAPTADLFGHCSTLWLLNDCVASTSGVRNTLKGEKWTTVGIRQGTTFAFSRGDEKPPAGARLVTGTAGSDGCYGLDFSLIPDFSAACCGVSLDPAWQDSSDLQFAFPLWGGAIGGSPDAITRKQRWKFTACDGKSRSPRVACRSIYISDPLPSLDLVASNPDSPGKPGTIKLQPLAGQDLIIGLLSNTIATNPRSNFEIDIAHLHATMKLCKVNGPVTYAFGEAVPDPCKSRTPDMPFLNLVFDPLLALNPFYNGTYSCCGRSLGE